MQTETKEVVLIFTWLASAIAVGALCGLGGCYLTERTKQKAIEAGLVEKNGAAGYTIWTKP